MKARTILRLTAFPILLASCGNPGGRVTSSSAPAESSPSSFASSSSSFGSGSTSSAESVAHYAISFLNYDGSLLERDSVAAGETPSYRGSTPTRESSASLTYAFSGWLPAIAPAAGDASYVAQFSETTRQYAISFVNYDGTVLQSGLWGYGATPVYTGAAPTKASDGAMIYAFAGFSPEIVPVVGEATYTAQFAKLSSLGSSVALGKYPQTVVEDEATLTALDSATDTDSDGYLEYGADEYKKVTGAPSDPGFNSASGGTTFATGVTYYFKVEPIAWRVLSGERTATGLVMAEKILDKSAFYSSESSRTVSGSTVYANNYRYSTLRAMLNGYDGRAYSVANFAGKGFLDVAFTEAEKAYIATTEVDNSAATTVSPTNAYACEGTKDKLFALSYQDLFNAGYGFSTNASRYGVLTDYARATGAWMSTYSSCYGNGSWWSRSPQEDSNVASAFGEYGNEEGHLCTAGNGIRPAFSISLA